MLRRLSGYASTSKLVSDISFVVDRLLLDLRELWSDVAVVECLQQARLAEVRSKKPILANTCLWGFMMLLIQMDGECVPGSLPDELARSMNDDFRSELAKFRGFESLPEAGSP